MELTLKQKIKIIAKFDGWRNNGIWYFQDEKNLYFRFGGLKYHTSMNWLLKAVYKFRNLRFKDDYNHATHQHKVEFLIYPVCWSLNYEAAIENTFEKLVEAIIWFNKIKNNNENNNNK